MGYIWYTLVMVIFAMVVETVGQWQWASRAPPVTSSALSILSHLFIITRPRHRQQASTPGGRAQNILLLHSFHEDM